MLPGTRTADALFADVLARAIAEVRAKRTPVYTFAFYHDHESKAVSVCVDTKANSARLVARMNSYNKGHFLDAVSEGDLEGAALWNANGGRSFALGDFTHVNVARTDLGGLRVGKTFHLAMVRALIACEQEIISLAESKDELVFCCSGAESEEQYFWSALDRRDPLP